jgi:hypothetical protein
MELLNEWVSPPILTRAQVTKSLGSWSVNKFLDPEDGVHFVEEELDDIEMGHVYLHKVTTTGYVQVYMPVKIMDEATGCLLSGLRSFKSTEPFVLQDTSYYRYLKDKTKVLKNKKCCLQHFRLSTKDFERFSSRVIALGAILEKDEVNVKDLLSKIERQRESIVGVLDKAEIVRSVEPLNEDELTVAITELSCIEEDKSSIAGNHKRISKLYDRLCSEPKSKSNKVRVELCIERLLEEYETLSKTDLTRIHRELVHKYKVSSGRSKYSDVPGHIGTLKTELETLSQYFPALRHLTVDRDSVQVVLGTVKIILEHSKVKIEGAITDLAPYASGIAITEEVGKRRRRLIVPHEK